MDQDVEKGDGNVSQEEDVDSESSQSRTQSSHSERRSSVSSARSGNEVASLATSPAYQNPPEWLPPDPANLGPWLVWFHRNALVVEIKMPKENFFSKIKSNVLDFSDALGSYYSDKHVQFSKYWNKRVGSTAPQKRKKKKRPEKAQADPRRFRVSIAELQRMHLRKLQVRLAKDAVDMRYNLSEAPRWEENLREYVQAVRDYDFMNECSQRRSDPFLVTGERWIDDMVLHYAMESVQDEEFCNFKFRTTESVETWRADDDNSPIGGTRNENTRKAQSKSFRKRLLIAAFGGFLLVGPMWLMVLHRTRYTALVSSTLCVAVFGLIMSIYLDKETDVLSSTAAYAAVLVVLVALNT